MLAPISLENYCYITSKNFSWDSIVLFVCDDIMIITGYHEYSQVIPHDTGVLIVGVNEFRSWV